MRVLAIIAVRSCDGEVNGSPVVLSNKPLLAYAVEASLASESVDRTVVTTDSPSLRDLAVGLGAEAPFLRPAELAAPGVGLNEVLQHCLAWLEINDDYLPDIVVCLEVSHPLRPEGLIDQVVGVLEDNQLDTAFTVYEERHAFWQLDPYGEPHRVGSEEMGARSGAQPLYREVAGLVLACRADLIRQAKRVGDNVAIVPIHEAYALVDTQDPLGLVLAEHILSRGGLISSN